MFSIFGNAMGKCNIEEVLNKFNITLSKKHPNIHARLNSGAADEEIQAFEKKSGFKFTGEIYDMYKKHNGEDEFSSIFGGWRWMPLKDILVQQEDALLLGKEAYSNNYDEMNSIPIFYNDNGVLYVKNNVNESPLYIRDNDYPEKEKSVADSTCMFLNQYLKMLKANKFTLYEHEARENNTYLHLEPKNNKEWP